MTQLDSKFSSLWIDKEDWHSKANELNSEFKDAAIQLATEGYVIFKNLISYDLIDKYLLRLNNDITAGRNIKISHGNDYFDINELPLDTPLLKILDTHFLYKEAESLIFSKYIRDFLRIILNEDPLAFQSLHFEVGSTQALHQDPAYVVLSKPLSFVASWIALEDVQPGSGELVYIPRSHRLPDFIYSQYFKHWDMQRDGNHIHDHHLHWLKTYTAESGLILEHFTPKKGDVLIWHPDLVHGGSAIENANSTRRSLVTHYCPASVTPHYFHYMHPSKHKKFKSLQNSYKTSFFYA